MPARMSISDGGEVEVPRDLVPAHQLHPDRGSDRLGHQSGGLGGVVVLAAVAEAPAHRGRSDTDLVQRHAEDHATWPRVE